MRRMLFAAPFSDGLGATSTLAQAPRPVIDVHIHYSQDAWGALPPPEAIKVLRQAGLKKAFVSSSSDDGTQMLLQGRARPDRAGAAPLSQPRRDRHLDPGPEHHPARGGAGSRPTPTPASASSTPTAPTPTRP